MGRFVNGVWSSGAIPADEKGHFQRKATSFRRWLSSADVAAGRYHLYVSYACPWAHRTLLGRNLLGLQDWVDFSVVHWLDGEDGWFFDASVPGATEDRANGCRLLGEVYLQADPHYTGSVTVPVLWDRQGRTIVNNESREILRQLSTVFAERVCASVDLAPLELRPRIDETLDAIYEPINNGVYRCGFARSQEAYDGAVGELFAALHHWDAVLGEQPFLCGDRVTEADLCMFTTLYRFDAVYSVLFKCSERRLTEFAHLWPYLCSVYQLEGVAETCNMLHIRQHYYQSLRAINPFGIVAAPTHGDPSLPHDRFRRFGVNDPLIRRI